MSRPLLEALQRRFPTEILHCHDFRGDETAIIKRDRIVEIFSWLRDCPETDLNMLVDVTAVDWKPKTPRFEVVYHLYSIAHGHALRLKVPVEEDDAWVPTVSTVWRTANWHERETYDLFGIKFEGHPDLRRILMPDDWDGHPLRKDYPLEGREWKFEPW